MDYLLDKLMEIDKKVEDLEKDVVMMNKQIGKRLQKITNLKEERKRIETELKGQNGKTENITS